MISVVMSVYKEDASILARALDSINNQTYKDFEFIIVLDNPDNIELKNLIQGKKQVSEKIKFIQNEINIGLPRSLNRAIKVANGEYIARMDADDISLPSRLQTQLEYMEQYKLDIVGCNMEVLSEGNTKLINKTNYPINQDSIAKALIFDTCIPHPTWVIRKEVYTRLNGYRDIHTCEDYDFLTRAVLAGYKVGNCPSYLYKYSYNEGSISRSNAAKQQLTQQYLSGFYKKKAICKTNELEAFLNSQHGKRELRDIGKYYKFKELLLHEKSVLGTLLAMFGLCMNKYLYVRRLNSIRIRLISNINDRKI